MRLWTILVAGALALAAPAARACAPEAPCEVEGGFYLAETPKRGPIRGALVFLHGWGGTGEASLRNRDVVGPALARNFAVIAPQGMPRRPGERGGAWNAMASPERRDDVAYLRAVIADARARLGLGDAPALAAGFSGGGMMVWRLACDAPGAAAAYAPVAGLFWRPLPKSCAGPVKLLHTHGWSDPVVPIEGRSVAGGRITQGDLFRGLDLMRATNGCARDDPDAYDELGRFWRRFWIDCAPGATLVLALHAGGHSVPPGWTQMALDWFEGEALDPAR